MYNYNKLWVLKLDTETYIRFLHIVNFILTFFIFIMIIIVEEEVKPTYILIKQEIPKINQMLIDLLNLQKK